MRKIPLKNPNKLDNTKSKDEQVLKPVRRLSNNGSSAFGFVSSKKSKRLIGYESELEADVARMLEFDNNVERFIEQPVKIPYEDSQGKKRVYVPDFAVFYRDTYEPAKWFSPLIIEVKPKSILKQDFPELKFKFKGAFKYVYNRNWRFKVMTEDHIRTQYIENVKTFLKYKNDYSIDRGLIEIVLDTLQFLETATPFEIIATASKNVTKQAQLLYALWHLVANEQVGCNLNEKINMNSILWYKTSSMFNFSKPRHI